MSIFDNDANIEMAALQDTANRSDALASRGICTHGWIQHDFIGSGATCKDCGKVFADVEDLYSEREDLLD